MKKEHKSLKHAKEFIRQPFSALKSFHSEIRPPIPTPSLRPAPSQTEVNNNDTNLFFSEMAGVRRLEERPTAEVKTTNTITASTTPLPKFEEQDQQLFLKALQDLELEVVFRDEISTTSEQTRALPSNRLRQLKSGAIRITCELDLHGMTRSEALKSLANFISEAYNRGQKAVLVITGKGNNSPGKPVLISEVANWLRDKGKGNVAEFARAPRKMGGGGAFVVFLKGKGNLGENTKI